MYIFFDIIKDYGSFIILLLQPLFLWRLQSKITSKANSDVQKKDIEELTNKLEGVKLIYSKENEIIKYQLNQLLNLKTQHRNEERIALIKFHSAYIHWIYLLQSINLFDYTTLNLKELLEKKLSLNDFFYNIHVERANLLLLVNDEEIIAMTNELIQKLISYKSFVENELLSMQFLLSNNEGLISSFLKLRAEQPQDRLIMEKIAKNETENRVAIKSLQDHFNENRTKEFLKCRYLCDDFSIKAKAYLLSTKD